MMPDRAQEEAPAVADTCVVEGVRKHCCVSPELYCSGYPIP